MRDADPTGAQQPESRPSEADPRAHYVGERGRQYHEERAAWRSPQGQSSRWRYFEGLTHVSDTVLDFGCGVGGVLAGLPARRRIGIEISDSAAALARQALDEVHGSLDAVASASIDAVISFHALEHVPDPFATLRALQRVLKPGGRMRLIVPCDTIVLNRAQWRWRPGDRDMHLFAWTPLTLGNLLMSAGLRVRDARVEPFTAGGRLAAMLSWATSLQQAARWAKGLRHGKLQVVADVERGG